MEYWMVRWNHDFEDEPDLIVLEVDAQQREIRKIELLNNRVIGYCDAEVEVGTATRSHVNISSLAEIAEDPQFSVTLINRQVFDVIWQRRDQSHK